MNISSTYRILLIFGCLWPPQKQIKEVAKEENKSEEEDDQIFIGSVENEDTEEDWTENIEINENPKIFIKFKLIQELKQILYLNIYLKQLLM